MSNLAPIYPYVAGDQVGGTHAFIGRADILRETEETLRGGSAVLLSGQRRIGKTSVLRQLEADLLRLGAYCPIFFDLQDKASLPLDDLLREIARGVAYEVDLSTPDLGDRPEEQFRDVWLPETLARLPTGTVLVLLFDEFDVLTARPDPDVPLPTSPSVHPLFPYLRRLLGTDPRLKFVFAIGRRVDELDTIANSLFKGVPHKRVSLMSYEETAQLARLSEAEGAVTLCWSEEAIERLYALTSGHPFLTQHLCLRVWLRAYERRGGNGPPTAQPDDVDAAAPEALEAAMSGLHWLWDGLGPAPRVVAAALAAAGPGTIPQGRLVGILRESGVQTIISELQEAPDILKKWDLIEGDEATGYCFRVELLRRWIARDHPLSQTRRELDQINPAADYLYQAARLLYQSSGMGKAADVEGNLRQAIGINPNHAQAVLLLSEILLAQGRLAEAREHLERLYTYRPTEARPRLIQALLAQAQMDGTGDDERLEIYDHILHELDEAQPEARVGRAEIWRQRAEAAEKAGRLEDAEQAYVEAGLPEEAKRVHQEMARRMLKAGLRKMRAAEKKKQYGPALALARELAKKYPEERDWEADLIRLERKTQLAGLYKRAVDAYKTGDRETAVSLLVEVIALDPGYEEATLYLHRAVHGQEPTPPPTPEHRPAGEPAKKEQSQPSAAADKPSPPRRLSRWNPLDSLRLLGWLLFAPARLNAHKAAYGEDAHKWAVDWLASTVVWLPLLLPVAATALGLLPLKEDAASWIQWLSRWWVIAAVLLAWLVTGIWGYSSELLGCTAMAGLGFPVACIVAGVVSGNMAVIIVLGMTFAVANVVQESVLGDIAFFASAGIAIGAAVGMAIGVGVRVAGVLAGVLAVPAVGVVVGVLAGIAAGFVTLVVMMGVPVGMADSVKESMKTGRPSRSFQALCALALCSCGFLIWFCFFGGWRAFAR